MSIILGFMVAVLVYSVVSILITAIAMLIDGSGGRNEEDLWKEYDPRL